MTTPIPTAVVGTLLEGHNKDGKPAAERISTFSNGSFFVDWYGLHQGRFTFWGDIRHAPRTFNGCGRILLMPQNSPRQTVNAKTSVSRLWRWTR